MVICNGNMVICDITLYNYYYTLLYLLTFQCAVLIADSVLGVDHLDLQVECSNQVSVFIATLYCYTYSIEKFPIQ